LLFNIFHLTEFLVKIFRFLYRKYVMFNEYRRNKKLWAKYGPICSIVWYGQARVVCTEEQSPFHILLPLQVKYERRDDRWVTKLHLRDLFLDMYAKDKRKRASSPYRLFCNIANQFDLVDINLLIKQGKPLDCKFTTLGLDLLPKLGDIAICEVVSLGKATVGIEQTFRAPKFEVEVLWETDNKIQEESG